MNDQKEGEKGESGRKSYVGVYTEMITCLCIAAAINSECAKHERVSERERELKSKTG